MTIYKSDYSKPHRSIKNKNLKLDLLLQRMFDFTYAGKANIFIHHKRDKFIVTAVGVHLVDDIYTFSPNFKKSWSYDNLYCAILAFNKIVNFITSSLDWYSPECFQGQEIYNELFITD